MRVSMLFRFSLYGFLKNQQYYEPFIILAFREKGLSFAAIGLLVGFRELCTNLMEVPSGVVADLCGRRRVMIFSFAAYIGSFAIFGASTTLPHLFAAMFLFAVGEAFRTGTHKAMILDWLRLQGRESEKTKTYGYTRSWSKLGSAASVIIAAGLVFYTGRFSDIFWFCIIPYTLGIINFLGYPRELDGRPASAPSLRNAAVLLGRAFRQAFGQRRLRRVLVENMGYTGVFKAAKDYLQPVLKHMAIALVVLPALSDLERTALVVGCIYFVLYLAESLASRRAHRLCARLGSEERAARALWATDLALFAALAAALALGWDPLAVGCFVLLWVLQDFWRPIAITRVDNETDATMGATMLSIESQAKALGAMILAPLFGLGVDKLAASGGPPAFWIVGAAGAAIALLGTLAPTMKSKGHNGAIPHTSD